MAASAWWPTLCGYLTLEQDAAKALPFDGMVWHYDVVDFLAWINGVTWRSEWQKYGLVDAIDAGGVPARPKSRK